MESLHLHPLHLCTQRIIGACSYLGALTLGSFKGSPKPPVTWDLIVLRVGKTVNKTDHLNRRCFSIELLDLIVWSWPEKSHPSHPLSLQSLCFAHIQQHLLRILEDPYRGCISYDPRPSKRRIRWLGQTSHGQRSKPDVGKRHTGKESSSTLIPIFLVLSIYYLRFFVGETNFTRKPQWSTWNNCQSYMYCWYL